MSAVCHTIKVKEAGVGGRLYSAIHTAPVENGSIIFLGDLETGQDEIYKVQVPATGTIGKERPMLVMCPEIIYDETRRANQALSNFINIANKAFPVIPLSEYDEIELSTEGFESVPTVGKYVEIVDGKMKLKPNNTKPTTAGVMYGVVVSSRKSSLPIFVGGDGQMFPKPYDLYRIQFRVAK